MTSKGDIIMSGWREGFGLPKKNDSVPSQVTSEKKGIESMPVWLKPPKASMSKGGAEGIGMPLSSDTKGKGHATEDFEYAPMETEYYEVAAPLLKSLGKCFPEAARLIQRYEPAMELVAEAAEANVTFGGYCEDTGGAYSRGLHRDGKVFVTRTETDPILAMKHFLFELTNGIENSTSKQIDKWARERKMTREQYAYAKVAKEARGTKRIAEIWEQIKPQMQANDLQSRDWNAYDHQFWSHSLYLEINDYTEALLGIKYTAGTLRGKTAKEYFMERFDKMQHTNS